MNLPLAAILAAHALVSPPDGGMAAWKASLGRDPAGPELAAAVETLGIARACRPTAIPRLMNDGAFRLRTLRDPRTRASAMALFAAATPAAPAEHPDLRQLMHSGAGDNCPLCRMRAGDTPPGTP